MFTNKEGQSIPAITFNQIVGDKWQPRSTEEIFKDKTVIVFALPGAYTPTCSSSHLPRYNELAPKFIENGVDEIVCVSVNDTFVMNAWSAQQNAHNISFIPDGNGDFSQAMGMLVDKAALGFGQRSWRYSMLVKNGIIEKMFIEADVEGDPFEVSDADTMLSYINPNAAQKESVVILSKADCPHCKNAKALLTSKGLSYENLEVGEEVNLTMLQALSNAQTVPQIFIDGVLIGGNVELEKYFS